MEKNRQILALSKNLLIAAWRLSGDGLALSVIAARCHLSQRERLLHPAKPALCLRLSLWESWRGAPERARMLTEKSRRSDSIALPKNLLIAAWRLSGDGLALSVIAARCHLSQRERLLHPAKPALCLRLSLWESWRGAPERARMLTEKSRRSDSIALPKNLLIAAWRLSGDGLALSVIAARCHLSQRERLLHPAKRARTPTESFLRLFAQKTA